MKPYGMKRLDMADTDVEGCIRMGRASAIGNLPVHGEKARAYRTLRGGNRKARARRRVKRVARDARTWCAVNTRPTRAEFEALAWEWSHLRGHDPNDTFFVSTDDGYDVVTGDHAACYLAETFMWKALACRPPRTGLVRDVSSNTEARDAVLRTTNFSRRETMPRVTLAYDTAWKQYAEHRETVDVTTLRRVLYGPCGRNGLFHTFFVLPLVTLHPESVRWSMASVQATGLYDRFDDPSEHFDAWANRMFESVLGYRSHEVQPLHGRWPDIAPIVRARRAREGIGGAP